MTTDDLARAALPYARAALKAARPSAAKAVGRGGWLVLWPAWALVTGPLLPLLVRLGVELAVALTAPALLPVLMILEGLGRYVSETYLPAATRAFLAELSALLKTPRSALSEPVRSALATPPGPGDGEGDQAEGQAS